MSEVYEIGKFYPVPTVYGTWFSAPGWWPVLGSFHEDSKHIGFHYWHYHIDARFLSATDFRRVSLGTTRTLEETCLANPLMLVDRDGKRAQFFDEHNPPEVFLRRRKCHRHLDHVALMDRAPWRQKLETAYRARRLVNGRCPHRGADLSRIKPDQHGCIACPLHGLVFKADTGEMVPREEWLRLRKEHDQEKA